MSEVGPQDRAKMAMYNAMNYDYDEIAAEVGFSESTVSTHVNAMEKEAKSAEDPEAYFWSVIFADVFDERFRLDWGKVLSDR